MEPSFSFRVGLSVLAPFQAQNLQPIQAQSHAITCTLLGEELASDYSLPPVMQLDPSHPNAENRMIKAQLRSVLMRGQPRDGHLCRSLEAVYGPLNSATYKESHSSPPPKRSGYLSIFERKIVYEATIYILTHCGGYHCLLFLECID